MEHNLNMPVVGINVTLLWYLIMVSEPQLWKWTGLWTAFRKSVRHLYQRRRNRATSHLPLLHPARAGSGVIVYHALQWLRPYIGRNCWLRNLPNEGNKWSQIEPDQSTQAPINWHTPSCFTSGSYGLASFPWLDNARCSPQYFRERRNFLLGSGGECCQRLEMYRQSSHWKNRFPEGPLQFGQEDCPEYV